MSYRVGVDSGGTFTDFLVVDDEGTRLTHKTASTPDDPARAVIEGLAEIAQFLGRTPEMFLGAVDLIVHGTTVATNALLTRRGSLGGLICTEGFRDVLPLRDGRREQPYDNRLPVPVPLVPRYLRAPVAGRLDSNGVESAPLDEDGVRGAAEEFAREGVEAVTVCLLHAPMDSRHEQRAAEIVREMLPDAYLTTSSELLPQSGYFERTSTSVMNSYVAPIIARYMRSLTDHLTVGGFDGVLLLMQSNGGVTTPDQMTRSAVLSLLSGPASGPGAGLAETEPLGRSDCITIDMGGTSFDAAIVRDGTPLVMTDGWVDRWRLALPMLDIHTVGAGGGSIAHVTEGGLLQVGPFSAGADPGPACYGRGGEYATVTDADVVLGYLDPAAFLGGRMALDVDAAREAIEASVARPLDLEVLAAAAGVYDVVNVNMAAGVREVTVNRGWDPRDFPLVVAGGAGPVHAANIADEMGIPVLVVPRESSVFCAGGMLLADFKHDFVRSHTSLLDALEPATLEGLWTEMRRQGEEIIAAEGLPASAARFVPSLDLRYEGQWHEINVTLDAAQIDAPDLAEIEKHFHREHDLLFGYASAYMPVETVSVRLSAVGATESPPYSTTAVAGDEKAALRGERPVWSRRARQLVDTCIYDGRALGPGAAFGGPAVIELPTTTIVVPETYTALVDSRGSFVLCAASHEDDVRQSLERHTTLVNKTSDV